MKDLTPKLISLLKEGNCTPQIASIAKKLKEPSTTIHYNIKKMEKDKVIKSYKAVFDHKKIDEGHCTYILINLIPEKYGDPEGVGHALAKHKCVESVDICTGDYELLIKLRSKDIEEYYAFVRHVIKQHGFSKVLSLTSLKQIKSEFVMV